MLCEKCNKNIANVYLKQNINGKTIEVRLCSKCAGELYNQNYAPPPNLFKSDPEPDAFNMFDFSKIPPSAYSAAHKKTCPMCGLLFADITKSGKAGCGECYETFKNELIPNVTRIHGTAAHTGKVPKNRSAQISAKRKIEELGLKLKKMVDDQNFEEAALIRDEINKLKRDSQDSQENQSQGGAGL